MIRLSKNIKKEYISHKKHVEKLELYEENKSGNKKDKPYTAHLKLSDEKSEVIIVKNLEKLSANLSYSNKTPSDCDFIIINLTEEEIYYIELKASNQHKRHEIKKQFYSGEQWLKHFCFCSGVDDDELESFKVFNIWWQFAQGRCSRQDPEYDKENNILKVKGGILLLGKMQNVIYKEWTK